MANCVHIATQSDLDHALAARETGSDVCIHVRGDAEESVLTWWWANRPEPEVAGDWGPKK